MKRKRGPLGPLGEQHQATRRRFSAHLRGARRSAERRGGFLNRKSEIRILPGILGDVPTNHEGEHTCGPINEVLTHIISFCGTWLRIWPPATEYSPCPVSKSIAIHRRRLLLEVEN